MGAKIETGRYRHFKGNFYEVIAVAKNSDTLGEVVVYKALYQTSDFPMGQVWTRSLDDFVAMVDVDGKEVPRFEYLGY